MNEQGAMQERNPKSKLRRFLDRDVLDHLFELLGSDWCGNVHVPLDHRTLTIRGDHFGDEYIFQFTNDSFEIGFGYPNRWDCFLRRETVHKFIWWYLRQWAFGEWFGLRRTIWYWLLHRRVEHSRLTAARPL